MDWNRNAKLKFQTFRPLLLFPPPLLNNVQTMYILLQILVKKVEFERRSGDDFTDGDQKDRKNMCACVCMYVEEWLTLSVDESVEESDDNGEKKVTPHLFLFPPTFLSCSAALCFSLFPYSTLFHFPRDPERRRRGEGSSRQQGKGHEAGTF